MGAGPWWQYERYEFIVTRFRTTMAHSLWGLLTEIDFCDFPGKKTLLDAPKTFRWRLTSTNSTY